MLAHFGSPTTALKKTERTQCSTSRACSCGIFAVTCSRCTRVCTMNCNCGRACAAKLASFKRHDGQLLNKPLCKHSEIAAGMFSKSSKAVSNTYAGQQQKVAIKKTIALGCIAQLSGGTTFSSGVPVSLGPSSTGPSCVSSSTGAVCEAFPDGCPTSFSGECSACCTQKQEDRHKHKNM